MPLYDYRCAACDTVFEKSVRMSEYQDKQECPNCSTPAERTVGTYAPSIGDPIRLGITKPDQGWKDLLRSIHARTPGSILKNNSSYI